MAILMTFLDILFSKCKYCGQWCNKIKKVKNWIRVSLPLHHVYLKSLDNICSCSSVDCEYIIIIKLISIDKNHIFCMLVGQILKFVAFSEKCVVFEGLRYNI